MQAIIKTVIKPLSVGVFALAVAACGGGGGDNGLSGAKDKSHGIAGDANGTTYNYNGDTRSTFAGSQKRNLNAENINNGNESWSVLFVPEKIGSYNCGQDSLTLALTRDSSPKGTATSCTVNVTRADESGIFGTFTATLDDGSDITNGTFSIIVEDAIGDADEDGLSDADDNCAFVANADQADSNSNGTGDACDAESEAGSNACSPQTDPSTLPNCGIEDLSQLCVVPGLDILINGLAAGTC